MIVNLFFKIGLLKYLMKLILVRWVMYMYIESNFEIFLKNKEILIFWFVLFYNKYIYVVYL